MVKVSRKASCKMGEGALETGSPPSGHFSHVDSPQTQVQDSRKMLKSIYFDKNIY